MVAYVDGIVIIRKRRKFTKNTSNENNTWMDKYETISERVILSRDGDHFYRGSVDF